MKREIIRGCALFCLTAATLSLRAATNYWDNNGDAPGFGAAGGVWGADANWSTNSLGNTMPDVTDTAAGDDLFFGAGSAGLAAGTVTVDGTNQTFSSLTFAGASGEITLTGGTLNLAEPSSIILINNGADTIASALAGTNGLIKGGTLTYTAFLTTNSTVIVPKATLADVVGAGGKLGGANLSTTGVKSTVYFFENHATNATYQLQYYDNTYTKCLKVELLQVGEDIAARVLYAKYLPGFNLGTDFNATGTGNTVATSYGSAGYGVAETYLYLQAGVRESFLTTSSAILFPNATLADFAAVASGVMGGSYVDKGHAFVTPFFFTNNGATATVQMQAFNGNYTKCVKVELTQSGADIAGRVLYSKYYNSVGNNVLGFDFDSGGTGNTTATSYTSPGYGITQIRLAPSADSSTLTLTGVNTYTGATITGGGTLEIGVGGVLGGGSYAGRILTSGTLFYSSAARQTFSGTISGTGSLVKGTPVTSNTPVAQSGYVQTNATVYFTGATLSDYLSADGYLGGNWIPGAPQATVFYYVFDGTKATCQFQALDDIYTKCVKVEFTQVGPDIAARGVYAKYIPTHNLGYNFDNGGTGGTIATAPGANGYGVSQITLNTTGGSTLTLAGSNSYTGGTTVDAGVLEATTSASALPSSGGITVNAYGELLLNVSGLSNPASSYVGGLNPITVAGGTLTLARLFNAGHNRPITINGGTLALTFTDHGDGGNYVNALTLMNGAQVTGYKLRVGYVSVPTITVSGTSPSTLAAGMNLVKNGAYPLTLNVADVTGDAATDFFITGSIGDYPDANYVGMPLVKTGDGTVSFSGFNTHTGTVTVTAGTLALDGSGALNAANDIVLNGGTLSLGAVTNACGTLSLSASSTLALGDGALAFADSSAAAWTNGVTLTLTGTLGPQTVRVGTDQNALTADQLDAITYNGKRVVLTPDGYLAEPPKGTIICIQ